jgi:hypothetical protein
MVATHLSFPGIGPIPYGMDLLAGIVMTGCSLWVTIIMGKRFQPFSSTLLCLTCLFGSSVPIALLQFLFPPVGALLGTLAPLLMFTTGGLVGLVCLIRARYRQEMQALTLLLFVFILGLLVLLLLQVLPLLGARDGVALCTAGLLIGAIAAIPHWHLRKALVSRLARHLPASLPHPQSPSTFGQALRMAGICAASALGGLAILWRVGLLGLLVPSLPGAGALFAWLLLMDTFGCCFRSLPPLPAYSRIATRVIVLAHPFDGESSELYAGPTAQDGHVPQAVQEAVDEALRTGSAARVDFAFDNGDRRTQPEPSYCKGKWPQCRTCACRALSATS